MKVVQTDPAIVYDLLSESKISLNYQPVINFREHTVYCIEALLNWKALTTRVFNSEMFIAKIEENSALSLALDSYVLRTAARDFNALCEISDYQGYVSVNISPHSLENRRFLNFVKELLMFSDDHSVAPIDPSRLVLEITERLPWSRPDLILAAIAELTALGVRFAVDDFITGYANFGVLLNENVTIVKIDRCITERLLEQKTVRIFAEQFKELANHLNKTVIVEGIEDCEQAMWLASHGYQFFQGYFFSVPTDIDGIALYLNTQRAYW